MTPSAVALVLESLASGVSLPDAMAAAIHRRLEPSAAAATWRDTLTDDDAAGGDLRARAEAASEAGARANAEASATPGGADLAEPRRAIPAVSPSEARGQGSMGQKDEGPDGEPLSPLPAVAGRATEASLGSRSPLALPSCEIGEREPTTPAAPVNSARERAAAIWEATKRGEALPATMTLRQVAEASGAREAEERAVRERMAAEAAPTVVRATTGDLEIVIAQAEAYAPGLLGFVLMVDARCIEAGMPPMSPWWRWSIGCFIVSGKPWGIWDVGRGAGKSTTLEKVCAAISRYGERKIPPGQTWTIPLISVGPDDANRRINGMAAVFRADGLQIIGEDTGEGKAKEGVRIARAPRGSLDLLDVRGNPIQIGSIAGTVGNVSGPSTVSLLIDEAAKLHDRVTNASPLTEIIASASQTSRGRAGWRGFICSSAYDRSGIHFQLVEQGDTETNFVARIGADFLDAALDGFERVAAWEQRRGDMAAAKIIREHAASLRADSPLVPTWVANPTLGNPDGIAWDGAALATRMLVEVLPDEALDGVPRIRFWLRECGSVPLDRGSGGANAEASCMLAARLTEHVSRRLGSGTRAPLPGADVAPMKLADMPPGDARYAGDGLRRPAQRTNWRTKGF